MFGGYRSRLWLGAVLLASAVACGDQGTRRADDAEKAGDRISDAAKDVTNDVGRAVGTAGQAADAAIQTADVKTALMADRRVDAGGINVDSDHTAKTVTLMGYVPTAAQKVIAEEIAVSKAPGYKVVNELTVRN